MDVAKNRENKNVSTHTLLIDETERDKKKSALNI